MLRYSVRNVLIIFPDNEGFNAKLDDQTKQQSVEITSHK